MKESRSNKQIEGEKKQLGGDGHYPKENNY